MPKDGLTVPLAAPRLRQRVPLSKPLRHMRYRRLWSATLVSNLGSWTQTFASAWLIASLSHSASTTTLVLVRLQPGCAGDQRACERLFGVIVNAIALATGKREKPI